MIVEFEDGNRALENLGMSACLHFLVNIEPGYHSLDVWEVVEGKPVLYPLARILPRLLCWNDKLVFRQIMPNVLSINGLSVVYFDLSDSLDRQVVVRKTILEQVVIKAHSSLVSVNLLRIVAQWISCKPVDFLVHTLYLQNRPWLSKAVTSLKNVDSLVENHLEASFSSFDHLLAQLVDALLVVCPRLVDHEAIQAAFPVFLLDLRVLLCQLWPKHLIRALYHVLSDLGFVLRVFNSNLERVRAVGLCGRIH